MVSKAYMIPGMKREIREVVSDVFGVPIEMLSAKTRRREVVDARYAAIWWTRKNTKDTLMLIGERYGIDHCTVMHACGQAETWMKTDKYFRAKLDEVVRLMGKNEAVEKEMEISRTEAETQK